MSKSINPATTLRKLTGGQVAFAVFVMPDGSIREVKLSQADLEKYNQSNFDAAKPDPGALFKMAVGGIPELNTVDGYSHTGDMWEADYGDGPQLYVKTSESMEDWAYQESIAADPVGGFSAQVSKAYRSRGNIVSLTNYDLATPPVLTVNDKDISVDSLGETTVLKIEQQSAVMTTQEPNHKSVTFDSTVSGQATTGTTITVSTVIASNTNRMLVGGATYVNGGGQVLNTVVFNTSESLTERVTKTNAGNNRKQGLWSVFAPTATTANTVFTLSATANGWTAGVWSVYGASQTTTFSNTATGEATNTAPTVTVTSAVGELVVSIVMVRAAASVDTPDGTWTTDWNQVVVANPIIGVGAHIAGAASVTRTDSILSSSEWTILAGSIPVPATGGGPIVNGGPIIKGSLIRGGRIVG